MGGCRGGWIQGLAVGRALYCCPNWRRGGTPSCWGRPDPQSTADHSTGKAEAGHWARRRQTGSWALDWWWKERKSISQRPAGGGTAGLLSVLRCVFCLCASASLVTAGETQSISWLLFMPYLSSAGTYLKGLVKTHEGSSRRLQARVVRLHPYQQGSGVQEDQCVPSVGPALHSPSPTPTPVLLPPHPHPRPQ